MIIITKNNSDENNDHSDNDDENDTFLFPNMTQLLRYVEHIR